MTISSTDNFYVELPILVDEQQMVDDAIDRLRARWPDWTPDDGDLEVVMIEDLAPMAADAARIAATMPSAALRAYGTKLLGIPYGSGSPAGTTLTITALDDAGYTVPAGGQLEIDGYAFNVFQDVEIPVGDIEVSGAQVYAAIATAGANDLTGALVAQLSLPSFVVDVTVDKPTAGGADPQTDAEYQSDISDELRLRAKSIITTRDFEIEALAFSSEIGRAMAIGNTARLVTVTIATLQGTAVSSPTKDALAAHYSYFEQVNTTYTINDPDPNNLSIVWSAKAEPLPFMDAVGLLAQVNAMLSRRLSPATWGSPQWGDPGSTSNWQNETTVRINELIAWIGGTFGVDYCIDVTINGNAVDYVMTGAAPLPVLVSCEGTVVP